MNRQFGRFVLLKRVNINCLKTWIFNLFYLEMHILKTQKQSAERSTSSQIILQTCFHLTFAQTPQTFVLSSSQGFSPKCAVSMNFLRPNSSKQNQDGCCCLAWLCFHFSKLTRRPHPEVQSGASCEGQDSTGVIVFAFLWMFWPLYFDESALEVKF